MLFSLFLLGPALSGGISGPLKSERAEAVRRYNFGMYKKDKSLIRFLTFTLSLCPPCHQKPSLSPSDVTHFGRYSEALEYSKV